MKSLCESFDLSCATAASPLSTLKKLRENELTPKPSLRREPCKKCAKIRNSVKKFFRAKFETGEVDGGTNAAAKVENPSRNKQSNHLRLHIFKDQQKHIAVIESHPIVAEIDPIENPTVCFGCDQPERVPSVRGPPIISPVCNGQVSASPLGEIFKNLPERVKKVVKIDRPRSLGPRKRITDKDPGKETSVHESRKSGRRLNS